MATMTLLEITQEILSNMSSDEVNSIGDTTESLQVANIVKQKYRDIISRVGIPEHEQLFTLTSSTDPTQPVLMTIPEEVHTVEWIKYFDSNVLVESDPDFEHDLNLDLENNGSSEPTAAPGYKYVTMLPNRQFIDMVQSINPSQTDVASFVFTDINNNFPSNFNFYYKTDQTPQYCTIIGNKYVLFDSFDNTQDDTLQASKIMCFGRVIPVFRMEDNFVPYLDDKEFSLLLNESKAAAFYELKQIPHAKAEQEIKRQWSSVQKNKAVSGVPSAFDKLPNFGRRGVANFSRRWWDGRN